MGKGCCCGGTYEGNGNAVQGIEIGSGFSGCRMLGSEHNDEFYMEDGHVRTRTNRCGSLLEASDIARRAVLAACASAVHCFSSTSAQA